MNFLKKFPTAVKIVLVLAILIIFVGGGIFGYLILYKEPKIVKSTIAFGEDHLARERALINAKPPYELADSISTYKNEERAIEYQYPANLFFFYSTIGSQSPEMRAILFQQPPEEKFFMRRVCPVDCIWVGTSLGYLGGALEYRGRARHAKRVKINGMDAVRYNVAEREMSGPYPVHIGYSLSENVTIQDPYLEERVIHISYFELFPKSLESPQSLKGRDIRQLFDPEKYKAFQTIVNSLQVLPIDTDTMVRSRSDELGISFQHPAFWGSFDNLYFNSSLTRGSLATINFAVHSLETANIEGDRKPPLFQYAGQPLEGACQQSGYLNISHHDVQLANCSLETLPSGLDVVILRGSVTVPYNTLSSKGIWLYEHFPPEKRKSVPFKAVLVRTKSEQSPGATIHTHIDRKFGLVPSQVRGLDFPKLEDTFDAIVSSLAYIRE